MTLCVYGCYLHSGCLTIGPSLVPSLIKNEKNCHSTVIKNYSQNYVCRTYSGLCSVVEILLPVNRSKTSKIVDRLFELTSYWYMQNIVFLKLLCNRNISAVIDFLTMSFQRCWRHGKNAELDDQIRTNICENHFAVIDQLCINSFLWLWVRTKTNVM